MSADMLRIAQNLGRNTNMPVSPCSTDKRPLLKGWPERASTEPEVIEQLWRDHPGPLIGIVTGSRSGVSVLDVDPKHPEAFVWWEENYNRLLPTRTFETRSGGLHLYFRHRDGVTNTQGKICTGVDTRGEGGYVISWWCAGFACRDHTPAQAFPDWLFDELTRQPPAPPQASRTRPGNTARAIDGIVRRLADAREGERNGVLYWCACRCIERGVCLRDIEALLLPVATEIGLHQIEARRTIGSAAERAAA